MEKGRPCTKNNRIGRNRCGRNRYCHDIQYALGGWTVSRVLRNVRKSSRVPRSPCALCVGRIQYRPRTVLFIIYVREFRARALLILYIGKPTSRIKWGGTIIIRNRIRCSYERPFKKTFRVFCTVLCFFFFVVGIHGAIYSRVIKRARFNAVRTSLSP